MKKIAIVALLSAFVATAALADNTGKFYIAGDLGKASYSNVTVPAVGGFAETAFPNPGMVRIAGGYHFSPMLAAEIGYSMFGDSTIDYASIGKATLALSSFQVAAVGTYQLNPQFDLTGKLGASSNTAKLTGTGGFAAINSSGSQSDLLVGVGAQYNVSSQVSIRAQYESFGKFSEDAQPIKATAFSLGVAYNFY